MAVVATLSRGYDLNYIWKQVGLGPVKDAAGYYLQASESGGEPPGRWWGPGARALGLEPGQVVDREPYDLLFGQRKAPDGTPLGRPPGNGRKAADIYARLLAAEPHATAERRHELRVEAARQARQGPLFFDLTISLSKSISINRRVHGRETGQWHEAELVVAHWLQHTSRDGDMQLHVHRRISRRRPTSRRAAKHGALDVAEAHAGWAEALARTLGVSLASVAPSVWHDRGGGHAGARPRGPEDPGPVPSQVEVRRAAQKAVALAQQDKSAWTRADVVKYLGRVLPRSGMDPGAAAALLEDLADRALTSEFEPVACLEAPELVRVPASLQRADRRSVYQRHGGVRYATHAQLTMEQRMLALARASGAPRMDRAQAARALGADLAQLDRALAGDTQNTQGARTRTGLRVDQAAAALAVLTDGKRVSVINAPAGSGKTWVLAAAGTVWAAAGLGRVIGITPSQSARNTLAAGVLQLRPVPGSPPRGARRPRPGPVAARRPGADGRGVHDRQPGPGRCHQPSRSRRCQGDPGR